MPGHPRLGIDRELGERPPAEIDGGAGERVVHRHGRVAVAGDPAPVAERPVERLAERERRVLDGVVVAGLEVAACPRRRGRGRRGRRAARGSGRRSRRRSAPRRARRRRARAGRRSASRRSRAGAGRGGRRASDGRGPVEHAGHRLDEEVVVDPVADRDPDAVVVGADDEPLPEEPLAEVAAVLVRDEEEVPVRDERRQTDRAQRRGKPLALLDHGAYVGRRGESGDRERGREATRPEPAPGARSAPPRRRARRARTRSARLRARTPWRTSAAR